MRALIIGPDEKTKIATLLAHAEKHVVSMSQVIRAANNGKVVGDDPANVCLIPRGFRVVFTYEMQKKRKARHISISVEADPKIVAGSDSDRFPHPAAVNAIITEFGFKGIVGLPSQDLVVWKEGRAINVLEFV
jgi:hypothetical protein